MTKPEAVADGKVVLFHYTLTDSDGEVLDTSDGGDPLPYLHGAGNIVPGLEKVMAGKVVGDKFTAVVEPEDGYGEHDGNDPQPFPRSQFPDDMDFEEGMPVFGETPDGEHVALWVADFDEEHVYLDANHPLAGVTLHFNVEIALIRDATEEETTHGHPHGADGTEDHDDDDDDDYDDEDGDEDLDDDDLDEDEGEDEEEGGGEDDSKPQA
jgi:FKBP-type peptidyl-prolyl cis-trans isomerase SlyD